MHHIRVDSVHYSYGDREVFVDASLVVSRGECIGLIGENGAGKSTLLRLIAGEQNPRFGRIERPTRTGLLHQEHCHDSGERVGSVFDAALAHVHTCEAELNLAAEGLSTDSEAAAIRYDTALAAAEAAEIWTATARRDALRNGLGVAGIGLDRSLRALSGGQRRRVALVALLLARPEALLLDEPTNHLDDDGVQYLRDELRAWRGPVVFASHDRAFLDEVASGLVDLDPLRSPREAVASITVFGGQFSEYLNYKAAERERERQQYHAEQEELARLRETVSVTARTIAPNRLPRDGDKFIYNFKGARHDQAVSRRIRNAEARLAVLENAQIGKPFEPLRFAGLAAPDASETVALAGAGAGAGVSAGYYVAHTADDAGVDIDAAEAGAGPDVLDAFLETEKLMELSAVSVTGRLELPHLTITPGSRLLVTGGNGSGKSTLLAVLAGTLTPDAGRIRRRGGVTIGLLQQDVRLDDPQLTARAWYQRRLGVERAENTPLASLGLISQRDENRPVGSLSTGQQRRLMLAQLIAAPPQVLLLDEPSNHLSLALVTELEEALVSYPGAVVVASHDRWLRQRWRGDRAVMVAGAVKIERQI